VYLGCFRWNYLIKREMSERVREIRSDLSHGMLHYLI